MLEALGPLDRLLKQMERTAQRRALSERAGRPRKLSQREHDLTVRRLLEGADLSAAALASRRARLRAGHA